MKSSIHTWKPLRLYFHRSFEIRKYQPEKYKWQWRRGGRAHLLGSAAASKKGFEHFDLGPLSLLSHSLFVTFPHLEILQLTSLSSKNL